jgi:cell division protein FtsI (penicillin-binding protein 3)
MLRVRRRLLLAGWVLAGAILAARSVQIQVLETDVWKGRAESQHRENDEIPAPRGSILDRDGVALASSHEAFIVSVAPGELKDREQAALSLESVLGLSSREARRITQSSRRWVQVRGRFQASHREALAGIQGIYPQRELERYYPHGDLARGAIGRVLDGNGTGGIEEEFDTLLQGAPGSQVLARDSRGRPIPGQTWPLVLPRAGGQVVLTLDLELQEIAEEALRNAVSETQAQGGTVLVTDPRTGEVLAMASQRDGSTNSLAAINTPFEPGSTLKPFTVAAILKHGVASLADSVDTENGRWRIHGRTLSDVHAEGTITLADALRVSSNVGIAKVAQGLTPAQQFENLRDFGFGMPTLIPLPGEADGTLRRPEDWSRQSAASLAIGYEVNVTPLQMAMAYGALANGGRLMEPRLVRELRDTDGTVLRRFEPRVIRDVLDPSTTRAINRILVDVVEDGTGTAARLRTFQVAGKSGTARIWTPRGYEPGAYFSSFVGFFPAENPQLVVFAMLERPKGAYYGGATAAPVTRATLEAILAMRRPPIDRKALAEIAQASMEAALSAEDLPVRTASLNLGDPQVGAGTSAGASGDRPGLRGGPFALPDLEGIPVRAAVRRLHSLGVRVSWDGGGPVLGTSPRAGDPVTPGDTIHLVVGRGDR